jgi:hypothetical protein
VGLIEGAACSVLQTVDSPSAVCQNKEVKTKMKRFLALIVLLASVVSAAPVIINSSNTGQWISSNIHDPNDPDVLTGFFNGSEYRSYYVFDLSSVTGTILSANLELYNGWMNVPTGSEDLGIFDVTSSINTLTTSLGTPGIFSDLGSGNQFGGATVTSFDTMSWINIAINAAGVAALQGSTGSQIAFGGAVTTIAGGSNQFVIGGMGTNIPRLVLTLDNGNGGGGEPEPVPEVGTMIAIGTGLFSIASRKLRRNQIEAAAAV